MKPWQETWDVANPPFSWNRPDEEENAMAKIHPSDPWVQCRRLAAAAPDLVRALLDVETEFQHASDPASCSGWYACGCERLHEPQCPVDAALTKAGLPTQAERDEARAALK